MTSSQNHRRQSALSASFLAVAALASVHVASALSVADQQDVAVYGALPWNPPANYTPLVPQGISENSFANTACYVAKSTDAASASDVASASNSCVAQNLGYTGAWFRNDLGLDSLSAAPPTGRYIYAAYVPDVGMLRCSGVQLTSNGTGKYITCSYYWFPVPLPRLIDPVSIVPGDGTSLLSGAAITQNVASLATGGRMVQGVSADGVAQVVVRVVAQTVGDTVTFTLPTTQCASAGATCTDSYGGLYDPLAPPSAATIYSNALGNTVTVQAQQTSNGPMAFAVYRAPSDFVRSDSFANTGTDAGTVIRTVTLQTQDGPASPVITSIEIVRPPVFLLHGNWSDSSSWESFLSPLYAAGQQRYGYTGDGRFYFDRIDYSGQLANGVVASIPTAAGQIAQELRNFRIQTNTAGTQADIVGYSMGGLLARALSETSMVVSGAPFGRGPIHKMITLDTPHLGSPFATSLLDSVVCKTAFNAKGKTVSQNIVDLQPNSALLSDLKTLKAGAVHIPTHAVTGEATNWQIVASEGAVSNLQLGICSALLPAGGFAALFGGPSDLIVGLQSEAADGLGVSGSIPTSQPTSENGVTVGVVHAVDSTLFPAGPDVIGEEIVDGAIAPAIEGPLNVTTQHVIDILNVPVTNDGTYQAIRP